LKQEEKVGRQKEGKQAMKFEIVRPQREVALPRGDERRVILWGWVARLRWRGGSLSWQRPLAVEVWRGAERQRIPIRDRTQRAVLAIWLAGAVLVGLAWLWRGAAGKPTQNRKEKKQKKQRKEQ
jgi:hypothetical protein